MNQKFFKERFMALVAGFPNSSARVTAKTEQVYFEALKTLPEEEFNHAVRHCLLDCNFFPTIHELYNRRDDRSELERRMTSWRPKSLPEENEAREISSVDDF
ncbi:MAG: hypothetical protein WD688_18170 [Candidatus Binatia bacterium]